MAGLIFTPVMWQGKKYVTLQRAPSPKRKQKEEEDNLAALPRHTEATFLSAYPPFTVVVEKTALYKYKPSLRSL